MWQLAEGKLCKTGFYTPVLRQCRHCCRMVLEGHKASGSLSSHLKNHLVLSATITSVQPEVASCRSWPRQQDPGMSPCVPLLPRVTQEQAEVLLSAHLQNDCCRTSSHGLHAWSDCPRASQHLFQPELSSNHLSLVPIPPRTPPPVKRLGSEQQRLPTQDLHRC